MRKVDTKMGITIFALSLIMAALCVGLFFWFSHIANGSLGEAAYNSVSVLSGTWDEGGADALTPQVFSRYYQAQLRALIPGMLALFFTVFTLFSLLLWRLLLHLRRKADVRLMKGLQAIMNDTDYREIDPVFTEIYNDVKTKFGANLRDYKRLHAYLSHEQKNRIAILRAALESSGEVDYLPYVDGITGGIDDILTLSETAQEDDFEEVDVALTCAGLCDMYGVVNTAIHFHFEEAENYIVWAKERWISCAVGNLLDNAVKYGDGKPVSLDLKRKKGSVIVTVKNSGRVMSEAEQEKIFAYEYRVQGIKRDGYGIGLSLVSHVCKLCGGFVYVQSEASQGTSFILSLPA